MTGDLKWLVVETGLLGRKKVFVPTNEVRRSGERLTVMHTKDRVRSAPHVEDAIAPTDAEKQKLCQFYGLQYAPPTGGPAEECTDMEDKRPGG